MSQIGNIVADCSSSSDWALLASELGPSFATRAAQHDADDSFVTENFTELKTHGVFAAGIPTELGGGGASYRDLCEMLRILGQHCSSTALALAMHTHLVAAMVYRWRREPVAVEALLQRIARERLILISTGASDWLPGSGTAERVPGGWCISGRKRFGSGVPMGDMLITGAVWQDPDIGATVLHFPLLLTAPGVRVLDTWRVLGMRGTGSHDVAIESTFIDECAVMVRRPPGIWHPSIHTAVCIAQPIVYAVYVGIAEAARDLAVARARGRPDAAEICCLVGEMESELATSRIAHTDMVETAVASEINEQTTNRIIIDRTILGRAVMATVEKAMEVAGGGAFYRDTGIERLFRDVQAARYHRPDRLAQQRYSGRLALGLSLDD